MNYNLRKRKRINCYTDGSPIRSFYVDALPEQATEGALTSYFSKYGEIEDCEFFRKESGFKYLSVTFKTAEAAAEAFARKKHRFLGSQIEVTMNQPSYQWDYVITPVDDGVDAHLTKRANESTNLTGTYLMSLNNDCLIQILSYLYINDLCSVAEACDRLRDLAGYVLSTRDKHEISSVFHHATICQTRRILANFGSFMTFLSISENMRQKLDSVILHCSDKLDHIELCQFVRPVNPKNLFADCMRLEELHLSTNVEHKNKVLEVTFPVLISLDLVIDDLVDAKTLRSFFERHPNLKTLNLSGSELHCPDVLESLVDNLPKLEKLILFGCIKYIENVQGHLKSLDLDCEGKSITPFLEESKSAATLESLKLSSTTADDAFYTSLARYKNIRKLWLTDITFANDIRGLIALEKLTELSVYSQVNITAESLIELVEKLPMLVSIILNGTSFVLEEDAYKRLAEIVTQHSNRPTLRIRNRHTERPGRNLLTFNSVKYYHSQPMLEEI